MELYNLKPAPGSKHKKAFRKGRGTGSGNGKTAGYGSKGQKARTGSPRLGFEGGQMPLYRRLPKRGFKSHNRLVYSVISLDRLNQFEAGSSVDSQALYDAGMIKNPRYRVKILSGKEFDKKLKVKAAAFSKQAREKIESLGGTCEVF